MSQVRVLPFRICTKGIRRNPVQPLIPQDCAEGSWDAVSIKFQYGVVGEHACLLAGGSRSSRLAEIAYVMMA